jgi:hypothetical protein
MSPLLKIFPLPKKTPWMKLSKSEKPPLGPQNVVVKPPTKKIPGPQNFKLPKNQSFLSNPSNFIHPKSKGSLQKPAKKNWIREKNLLPFKKGPHQKNPPLFTNPVLPKTQLPSIK